MADPAAPAPQDAEALLESSWGRRGAPLPRRERLIEAVLTGALLAACLGLLHGTSPTAGIELAVIPVLGAYAASIRVTFPVGTGFTSPSQLFLVPLFALAPPPVVPLLVVAGLVLARLVDVALGRTRMDRLVVCGGNAIYTLRAPPRAPPARRPHPLAPPPPAATTRSPHPSRCCSPRSRRSCSSTFSRASCANGSPPVCARSCSSVSRPRSGRGAPR